MYGLDPAALFFGSSVWLLGCNSGVERTSHQAPSSGSNALPLASPGRPIAATQRTEPPFGFASGSPHEFFANDHSELEMYLQRESKRTWGIHADVAAGPGEEWIVEVSRYALIVSPESVGFWYRDFGSGSVSDLQVRRLTHSAKPDIIARYWQNEGQPPTGYKHDILEVWSFGADGPAVRFAVEVGVWAMSYSSEAKAPPHASCTVALHDDSIVLTKDKPWHVDAKFQPTSPADVEPRMAAGEKRRVYRWDSTGLLRQE